MRSTSSSTPTSGRGYVPPTYVKRAVKVTQRLSITVQGTDGQKFHHTVDPNSTIGDLKKLVISDNEGKIGDIRMVFEGRVLENYEEVGSCLRNGVVVNMTSRLVGGSVEQRQRIMRENRKMQTTPAPGISAGPSDGDLFVWNGQIVGPRMSEWNNGIFPIRIVFPTGYPKQAPKIKFVKEMFHPNVYTSSSFHDDGEVCLSSLSSDYDENVTIISLLVAIQAMLAEPNVLSPANPTASDLFQKDRAEYHRRVRLIVSKS